MQVRFVQSVGVAPSTSTLQYPTKNRQRYFVPYATPQDLRSSGLGLINETDAWLTGRPYGLPGTTALTYQNGRASLDGPDMGLNLGTDFVCDATGCHGTSRSSAAAFRDLLRQINRIVPDANLAPDGVITANAARAAVQAARASLATPGLANYPELNQLASGVYNKEQIAERAWLLLGLFHTAAEQGALSTGFHGALGDDGSSSATEVLRQLVDVERESAASTKKIQFWVTAVGVITTGLVLGHVAVKVANKFSSRYQIRRKES